MATTTQNLGLIKPAGTDKIRIAQINSNMDTLDAKIGAVGSTSLQEQLNNKQGALTFDSAPISGSTNPVTSGGIYNAEQSVRNTVAIVASGNTAPQAITAGEFVQWQGALYTATANIPSGGTLSTSNLQAAANGGLNALKSSIDTLNSKLIKASNLVALCDWGNYCNVDSVINLSRDITLANAVFVIAGWNQESAGYTNEILFRPIVGDYYTVMHIIRGDLKYTSFIITNGTKLTITASNDRDIGIRQILAIF